MSNPTAKPEAKTHECSACDGTGCELCCFDHDHCGNTSRFADCCRICPVCLGSGVISDAMPVSDALADAETLRLEAEVRWYAPRQRYEGIGARTARWIDDAADIGRRLRAGNDTTWIAAMDALFSARAAFRAVPGLREAK